MFRLLVNLHFQKCNRQNFWMPITTGQKNRALQVPPVVPYKALGNLIPKPITVTVWTLDRKHLL